MRATCATVFVAFTFAWLYFFQADTLAVGQHALSGGQTHYDRLVGALLITLALLLLRTAVYALTRLRTYAHALVYLPSFLALAVVTDISPDIDLHFSLGAWWWVVPAVLLAWAAVAYLARGFQPFERDLDGTGFFSRLMWVNVLLMALMMVGVVSVGSGNAVFHYRAHAETALRQGQLDEALRVGRRSLETDESLTMLRAYALSRQGQLGERLFQYPVSGTGADLLPMQGSRSRLALYPADSLYRHLGARPRQGMTTAQYLSALERLAADSLRADSLPGVNQRAVADYRLCGLLVDRRIDDFARMINRYYEVNDQLPRHYREALILYAHLRSAPVVLYTEPVMETDFADLQSLEAQYADAAERRLKVAEKYRGSYWYYYEYEKRD